MPLNPDIKRVLIIGSGPIVIGQAAEFDYAGSQACRALKEAGLEVILVNPNPATIMTDQAMATKVYIEPLTLETMRRIIVKEKPDSLLSTLGGQSGLTLSMQLDKEGFLLAHGVKLLGANRDTIEKAEDRQQFKDTMIEIGQPVIPSQVVTDVKAALAFAVEIGYPVIVRPAYTLGGSGGGIAADEKALLEIAQNGLRMSPIGQILVEKCISGWKEIEFEVMRDAIGNVVSVCSMENFDPVGVHTGDSIVAAPALTLADKEFQMLRRAALDIISALKVEGGCNVQFALKTDSFDYAVIEVNPRVSRSSALASKATGYPIAKVSAQIAIGYTLDEIKNAVTGKTCACFEPALDYVVVKLPKWPFDKFVYGRRTLGTQMKATGEVMAIGTCFEQALMKAVRGAEISQDTLRMKKLARLSKEELMAFIGECTDERLFALYEAMDRGVSLEKLNNLTQIDLFFLSKVKTLLDMEKRLAAGNLTEELYLQAKKYGYPDKAISRLSGCDINNPRLPVYKMVDTCAAEFEAQTPYFYATYDEQNEAEEFIQKRGGKKPCVVVLGSGPIRIGQGIEFDYASVHCVWTLKQHGYDVVLINNNPETVSTDFDTADRLYFEPLTPEDVMGVLRTEKPMGVVVAFGGQTAIKLTGFLHSQGINILGTSADNIDAAEDRKRFDEILERIHLRRPAGCTVLNMDDALAAAQRLGYPVLLRPSYVLGGQNMIIAYGEKDVLEYMDIITATKLENPVLIDKYMMGTEVEVDAICDGENFLIPGIMEHIERAGVHSGDSISVYPCQHLSKRIKNTIIEYTGKLACELKVIGLVNVQYVVYNDMVYVIEVNPRSSRTVPYISKVTGVPMVDMATQIMLGKRLTDFGLGTGLYPAADYVAVKVPVFSFEKLHDVDTHLGPEMKSTGEVLGIAKTFEHALLKGLVAAGYNMKNRGGVLFSVRDSDKEEVISVADRFAKLGFDIYATAGTALKLNQNMVAANAVRKAGEDKPNVISLLESGKIDYVMSTSAKGRKPQDEGVKLRRKAVERSIACLTSIDTARALLDCLEMESTINDVDMVDITKI